MTRRRILTFCGISFEPIAFHVGLEECEAYGLTLTDIGLAMSHDAEQTSLFICHMADAKRNDLKAPYPMRNLRRLIAEAKAGLL